MGLVSKTFDNLGQKIGEGNAKQGKSWDEVVNMPSSGSGLGKALINSSAKTGYDNYMAGTTGSQYGKVIEEATNRVLDSDLNTFKQFKQSQPQGDMLGTQGIKPYDSQSSAQSMNVNPMLNNSIGSLGQNNTGGIGISGFGNRFTTQKSNGLGNIVGYNPQGNNYNIIGGVELV